jgi:hypothetical protein
MPTNAKETKGVGKALFDAVGLLSFLFGSLVLLAIVFGMIGSIFMSTKRLFQVKRVKRDEDNSHSEPEGQMRELLLKGGNKMKKLLPEQRRSNMNGKKIK